MKRNTDKALILVPVRTTKSDLHPADEVSGCCGTAHCCCGPAVNPAKDVSEKKTSLSPDLHSQHQENRS